jgi:transposase-like protein
MNETTETPDRQAGPACPFCGSTDSEMIALFGSQLLTSQFYCRGCHTVFEAVRHEAGSSAEEDTRTSGE